MRAGLRAGIISTSGGGVPVGDWNDISGGSTTGTVTGSNANSQMGASGTLNFNYLVDSGTITYSIIKNNVGQGQVASIAVTSGDTIRMQASGSGFTTGEERTGTIGVTGLYTDNIGVTLRDFN